MVRSQPVRLLAASAIAGIGLAAVAAAPASAARLRPALVAPVLPSVPVFASPTVVDNYRPGFEPDVAVDHSGTAGAATRLYTSTPFGFSTTQSFIERSDDAGDSFHNVQGQISGKPLTCVGGGDTEAQVDRVSGRFFFVDLQGLTEYSTSKSDDHGATFTTTCAAVTGTGVDRQWVGLDTNGGTTAVGVGSGEGRAYLDYDNVAQATGGSGGIEANQLVINQSQDGVQYGSACAPLPAGTPDGVCAVPATVISPDEGLPGNLLVDDTKGGAHQHSVYAVHTNGALDTMVVSICRGAATGVPTNASTAADYCTDPTAVADPSRVSTHWKDVAIDGAVAMGTRIDKAFPVIALDTVGNLYATWASTIPDTAKDGGQGAPAQIYVAMSTDGGQTWSPRQQVNAPAQATNIFPWISAGDPGHIDIAWYGSQQTTGKEPFDSDALDNGLWDVYLAQSLNLTSDPATSSFSVTKVSDHHAKFGNISTGGLGGAADRSLGDYMQVQTGRNGEAVVSYVDDTSTGRNQDFTGGTGQSPPEAAGPTLIAKQIGGPSLFSTQANLQVVGARDNLGGATAAVGSVGDPTGDAFVTTAGQQIAGSTAQDLGGATVTQPDPSHLTISLKTSDPALASHLMVPAQEAAAAGTSGVAATTGVWMVRWAERYEPALKDGAIRYVAMQSTEGGTPQFYTGTTTCIATTRCKFFSYPVTTDITSTSKITGSTISWTVPLTAIGSPGTGSSLYSLTGSSAAQTTPSTPPTMTAPTSGDPANSQLPLLVDATPSFSFTLGNAASGPSPDVPETPYAVGLPLVAVGAGALLLARRRRRTSIV